MPKKKKEEKPREYSKRQLSHFQRQRRRQRIIFIAGVSVIVAIVLIVAVGWYMNEYRPLHRTVIKVGDTKFDTRYYVDALETYYQLYSGTPLESIDQSLADIIVENELIKQAAAPLGITVTDADIEKTIQDSGQKVTAAYVDVLRAQKLDIRLKDEYFGAQVVPVSDNQVHLMAMLVESESVAIEARDKLVNGDNFSALVDEYALDTYSKSVNGDYGLHPRQIFEENITTPVPLDFAFTAEAGTISPPLADNASYKSMGYWLINVLDRPSDNESTVDALLLGSREQALDIKARLEAGDNLSALADQYSQYTTSREQHGDMGVITRPSDNTTTAVSTPFDTYVFDPATELGKWSDPIPDTKFATQGGCWLVQVVEKETDAKLSDEDRSSLIDSAFSDWANQTYLARAADIDVSALTQDVRDWAIARATKELQAGG